mgnify:CR=1 FL=1
MSTGKNNKAVAVHEHKERSPDGRLRVWSAEQNWLITISLVIMAVVTLAAALIYTRTVMIPFVVALFIAALADFLHKYNAENAQVMETRSGPYRPSVRTSDIDEIVALIDRHGPEPVANLLIAYGYARLPREKQEDKDEPTQEEIEE